jgi:hypothetical protein
MLTNNMTRLAVGVAVLLLLFAAMSVPAAAASLEDFYRSEDGRFDMSRYLLEHEGFLPVPIVITEPAIGYGGGAALLFFNRNAPISDDLSASKRFTPPDITAVGGMGTENGTRGAFAGHLGYSADGHWRYLAAAARTSLNLSFYGDPILSRGSAAEGLGYNLESDFLLADVRHRVGASNWFAGLRYLRADSESRFDGPRPEEIAPRQQELTIAGMAAVAEYDGRDNIFTPNTGTRVSLYAYDFDKRFGGDTSFHRYTAAVNSFWPVHPDVVIGGRLDWRSTTGDTPFYALPYIELRGIPAMRYQGERVAMAEVEARWNLDGRWSLVAFGGSGRSAPRGGDLASAPSRNTVGAGFRYYLAKELGLHAGIDVARGPDDHAIYIIFGSAWR